MESEEEHSEFSSKQNYILVASPVVGVDCTLWDTVPALRNSIAILSVQESEEFEYHWIYNTTRFSEFVSPGWIIWSIASFIKVSITTLIITGSKYGRLRWPLGQWTLRGIHTLCSRYEYLLLPSVHWRPYQLYTFSTIYCIINNLRFKYWRLPNVSFWGKYYVVLILALAVDKVHKKRSLWKNVSSKAIVLLVIPSQRLGLKGIDLNSSHCYKQLFVNGIFLF